MRKMPIVLSIMTKAAMVMKPMRRRWTRIGLRKTGANGLGGQAQHDVAGGAADLREGEDRPTAFAIADGPEHRSADELADRVDREEQGDRERILLRLVHVER